MRRTRVHRRGPIQRFGAAVLGGLVLALMMPYPSFRQPARLAPERSTTQPVSAKPPPQSAPPRPAPAPAMSAAPSSAPPPAPTPAPSQCPDDMALVEGEYCTQVRHTCEHWLDDEKLPFARCGRYAPKAQCVGKRVPKRFCIDRFESADADGLPVNHQSFHLGRQRCAAQGKRLCTESEWNFACE